MASSPSICFQALDSGHEEWKDAAARCHKNTHIYGPDHDQLSGGDMPVALVSAWDKKGLNTLGPQLIAAGYSIYGSQGTVAYLHDLGVAARDIAELVGGGPMLGHRVVSLAREIHAGLLAKDIELDRSELAARNIPWIDFVYVNFYPLEMELENPNRTLNSVFEATDIGGPAMVMAAVKGQRIVVCQDHDLPQIGEALRRQEFSEALRRNLWITAAGTVSAYYYRLAYYLKGLPAG